MTDVLFEVVGIPQPQGSARAFTYTRKASKGGGIGARVDSDNPMLYSWRRSVAFAARRAYRGALITGPVRVVAAFYLPAPKKLRWPKAHTTRPDADKLARGIADAMTGVLYADDSQITQFKVTKEYAAPGASPRAVIVVTPLTQEGLLI